MFKCQCWWSSWCNLIHGLVAGAILIVIGSIESMLRMPIALDVDVFLIVLDVVEQMLELFLLIVAGNKSLFWVCWLDTIKMYLPRGKIGIWNCPYNHNLLLDGGDWWMPVCVVCDCRCTCHCCTAVVIVPR